MDRLTKRCIKRVAALATAAATAVAVAQAPAVEHAAAATERATTSATGPHRMPLETVSCRSRTLCLAAGGRASKNPFATYSGHHFHPRGDRVGLGAVSCPTHSRCIAVGSTRHYKFTAHLWNGHRWTPMAVRSADQPPGANILSLSCTSLSWCVGVGGSDVANRPDVTARPLAETWNGHEWRVTPIPSVHSTWALWEGVSCWARKACLVAGENWAKSRAFTSVLTRTRWRGAQTTGLTRNDHPTDVSCTSSTFCVVAGVRSSPAYHASILLWNGQHFVRRTTPYYSSGGVEVGGVSCLSRRMCLLVGLDFSGRALAMLWTGSGWRRVTPPRIAGSGSGLNDVSCVAPTFCIAVGESRWSGPDNALAERFDGRNWSLVKIEQATS